MAINIFRSYAPQYYAAGINVIPLYAQSKRPLVNAWADYADFPISKEVQDVWLNLPDNHNIGVVLGKHSNLGMLDIDYADEKLIEEIRKILPEGYDTWERVGKKGMVFAFRFNPNVPKAFKLISKEHGTICEYLCSGQQVVLPPSIHPDTKQPYYANSNLWEVIDKLPIIPDDLEDKLRNLIELNGISLSSRGISSMIEYVPAGFRDNSLTQRAGFLANEVIMGRVTLQQAIDGLYVIHEAFTEKVEGDSMDMDKHISNLLKFLQKSLTSRQTVLPTGWDENLDVKIKQQLNSNEAFVTEESYDAILSWVESALTPNPNIILGSADHLEIIDKAVLKLSQLKQEDNIREAFVVNKIVGLSQLGLKGSDVTKRIKTKRSEIQKVLRVNTDEDGKNGTEINLNTHTEVASAALDYLQMMNPIRVDAGILYMFMGSHWVLYPPEQVKQFIAKNYIHLDIMKRNSDIDGVYKQMLILADANLERESNSYVNVANGMIIENNSIKIAPNSPEMVKKIEQVRAEVLQMPQVASGIWSSDEIMLAQNNAEKHFIAGLNSPLHFVNHTESYGATYVLPYRYMPEESGKMPLFEKFLKESWGHRKDYDEMKAALQEALYVSFMGCATKYQRAFLLYGVANSGKSVLLNIVASLFPDEAKSSVSFDRMHENRYFVALHKKNINIIGELSERKKIEGDIFKSVIDGTPMSAYQLYRESFMLKPTTAHWAASNHLPKTYDTSEGFTRRWLFFYFDEQVSPDRVDVDLAKKIICQEREAIFAWALEAGPRLLKNQGYTLPMTHKQLLSVLACQTNPALFFLIKDPSLEIKKFVKGERQNELFECTELDLHLQFRQFMRLGIGSNKTIEMQEFRHMLDEIIKSRGIERFTKDGDINQWYRGIRIKNLQMR